MARLPKKTAKERRKERRAQRTEIKDVRIVCDRCGLEQAAVERQNCLLCGHDTGSTHDLYNKVNPMGDHFG